MSDLLANERTLDATSQDGQSQRASEESQSGTDGQPSDNGQAVQENIRKLQSTYDKKVATLQQQIQQSNLYIQQMQQQMREAQRNAAPDDYSKLEIDLQFERQEKAALAQRLAQAEAAQAEANARTEAFTRLADRYGVDVEDIEKAKPSDYDEAVEAAIAARDKRKQRKQQDDDDRRDRNRPDVGGGAPRTPTTKWDEEYKDAMRRGDSVTIARLLRTQGK